MRRPVAATTGSSNQRRGGQWMWWLPLLWFFTTPYWIVGYTIANSPPIDPDCPLSAECTVKYESVSGQVATFFTTDAAVSDNDLVMLDDPQVMILPQPVIPLVTASVRDNVAAVEAINAVQAALQTEDLVALNKQVDVDHLNPAEAATQWLQDKGLV